MKKLIHSKSSIFTSKANVLEFLQSNTSKSKIEKLYYFTVNEWIKNNQKIVNNIMNNFENLIIVRSSAFGEDSIESSQAGTYESILNVNPKSIKEITKGVSSVIKSYMKKLNHNKNNVGDRYRNQTPIAPRAFSPNHSGCRVKVSGKRRTSEN